MVFDASQKFWVISILENVSAPSQENWSREAWLEVKSIISAYLSQHDDVKIYKDVVSTINNNIG